MSDIFEEYPKHDITKETRERNSRFHQRTLRKICDYIYDQTDCDECRKGIFCSRDGDKWGCLSYNNIAEHLNHIGWKTSRGNKWQIKTVRDQITKRKRKVAPHEKKRRIDELNKQRNDETFWEVYDQREDMMEMVWDLMNEFGVINVPVGSNVDELLQDLKGKIMNYHRRGQGVSILLLNEGGGKTHQ